MSSHLETSIRASTVDKNSAKSPSDTGCSFCDESDQSAGTEGCFLCGFDFVSCDALPEEEYRTYYGSKCDGEQGFKTELPSAVSKIPDYRVTHTASTDNTRNSKSRPVQGRQRQSGETWDKVRTGRTTKMHTRSQGPVPSEEDGTSTAGDNTAVDIKDDTGHVSIKEEDS
jgi:hypothetical protein